MVVPLALLLAAAVAVLGLVGAAPHAGLRYRAACRAFAAGLVGAAYLLVLITLI